MVSFQSWKNTCLCLWLSLSYIQDVFSFDSGIFRAEKSARIANMLRFQVAVIKTWFCWLQRCEKNNFTCPILLVLKSLATLLRDQSNPEAPVYITIHWQLHTSYKREDDDTDEDKGQHLKKGDLISQLKLFENSLHYICYEKALVRNRLKD